MSSTHEARRKSGQIRQMQLLEKSNAGNIIFAFPKVYINICIYRSCQKKASLEWKCDHKNPSSFLTFRSVGFFIENIKAALVCFVVLAMTALRS